MVHWEHGCLHLNPQLLPLPRWHSGLVLQCEIAHYDEQNKTLATTRTQCAQENRHMFNANPVLIHLFHDFIQQ